MAEPSDLTEWKPKLPGFSLLSKGLAGAGNFLAKPFGFDNPPGAILADMLGIKPAAALADKLAYGDNLTQGKGQTFSLAPDVFDGALALAPATGGLLKGMGKLASKVPLARDSAPAALYGGSRYPEPRDPGLFMSHGTTTGKLLGYKDSLPQELYHLSQAITRGKLSEFSGPDTWLIPQYGRFEPKLDQTVITATDSYSPRYQSALGARVDSIAEMRKDLSRGFVTPDEFETWRKKFANNRIADQFGFPFEQGGLFQEGVSADKIRSGFSRLRNFGTGTDFPFQGGKPLWSAASIGSDFNNRVAMSPRFQSLQHYEASPYGGALLGEVSGHNTLSKLQNTGEQLIRPLWQAGEDGGLSSFAYSGDRMNTLRRFASGFADPLARSEKGRKFDADRTPYDFSKLRIRREDAPDYSENPDHFRALSSEEISQVRETAAKILSSMKKAPSDYAEVKRYGPTKLNPDTFAGIVTKSDSAALENQAKARGLGFERVSEYPSDSELTAAADSLQKAGKKGESIYMGGMAAPALSRVSGQVGKTDLVDKYNTAVAGVKDAANALKKDPTNPNLQAAYQKAADAWKLDSDLFVQGGHISSGEHAAMQAYLTKQINAFQKSDPVDLEKLMEKYKDHPEGWLFPEELKDQNPGLSMDQAEALHSWAKYNSYQNPKSSMSGIAWSEELKGALAGLEKHFPKKKPSFGDAFLDDTANLEGLAAGHFDYLPESSIAALKTYAAKTGDVELNQLAKKYEATLSGHIMKDHDDALHELLAVVDGIKAGKLPVQKAPPVKDWSKASWDELKAVSGQDAENMSAAEWQAWDNAWSAEHKKQMAATKPKSSTPTGVVDAEYIWPGATTPIKAKAAAIPDKTADFYKTDLDKHYQANGGYIGYEGISEKYPELTDAQKWALSDYSWTQTKTVKNNKTTAATDEADALKAFLKTFPQAKTPPKANPLFSGLGAPVDQGVDFSKMTKHELNQVNTDALSHTDMMKWLKAVNDN